MPPKKRTTRRSKAAAEEEEEDVSGGDTSLNEEVNPPSSPGVAEESESAQAGSEEFGQVEEPVEETSMEVGEAKEEDAAAENVSKRESDSPDPPAKKQKLEEAVENNEDAAEKETAEEKSKKRPPELEKFWKAVEDDPTDFTGWTYLLQYVDTTSELHHGQEAFDKFLYKYPYCYGYWKKYADFEKRKGSKEKCMMVFERGIKAIPLSADLWIHYLNHIKAEYTDSVEFVRAQYERAMSACGREWRSDKLWDHYVKWEAEQKNLTNVLKLYDRIVRNPTQGLSHQFEMFRDFVKEHNPKDILEVSDFLALRKEVLASLNKDTVAKKEDEPASEVTAEVASSDGDAKKDDEGAPPGEDDSKVTTDEENTALREKIIFSRKKVFKETEERVQSRWKFEDNIKRPYFHMKPLERGQLKNWNEYLDFEIKEQKEKTEDSEADEELVEILFERCLIACALYEEFWTKYVKWTRETRRKATDQDRIEKVRDIYERACKHHLPNKVDIHLQYAAFEEECGDFAKSAEILQELEAKHPEMLSLLVRRINLERRRGNIEAVHENYKSCIEKAKKNVKSDLSVKYSRFLRLQLHDVSSATEIINQALVEDERNPKLYLQLLDILLHQQPLDVPRIMELFDTALKKSTVSKHQLLFSQRKVEFLEDFGTDIRQLVAAQDAHTKLSGELKATVKAEEGASTNNEEGAGIKTIEGRTGNKKTNGATTYPATNSASYAAHHNSQYQQYGSRYNAQQYSGGYGQYGGGGGYYGGYQQGYGGYGGGGGGY